MKILNVVGTRPNFIKIAPILEQMKGTRGFAPVLLHTGQHYDENMNRVFFDQLGIPKPDFDLGVGSGSPAAQISEILRRFEPVLGREKPEAVLVVGDVNSTVSCALAASYAEIPVVHVEAGLRSFDRSMPEEINRLLTDQVASLLFTTEKSANENLRQEGIAADKIHFVGNVMVDTLFRYLQRSRETRGALQALRLEGRPYALVTLHRPSNVDHPDILKSILEALGELSRDLPLIFPIHPRTRKQIQAFGLEGQAARLTMIPPQSYLDMLQLMAHATLVLTDSGGMQEETTILNVPCLTLRQNTERPVTVEEGTSLLVGNDGEEILRQGRALLNQGGKKARPPELWDGRAAERIVQILRDRL